MNPTSGSVIQSASQNNIQSNNSNTPTFNSTLIDGLKKSGNGVVIKVPAGVKSINVRPMRATSASATVNVDKLQPIKVDFNNISRDNFITLRFDAEGKVHATVVDDLAASIELDVKMGQKDSKIGIINGENRSQNETKNLRIRESIDGKFNTSGVHFLSAGELSNTSARLSQFFKKFRSMTEDSGIKDLSMLKKFKPMNRKQGRQGKKNKDPQKRDDRLGTTTPKKESIEEEQLKDFLIKKSINSIQEKIQSSKKNLKAVESRSTKKAFKNSRSRHKKKEIKNLKGQLEKLEKGLSLLKKNSNLNKKDTLERKKLLVGIFMDEKKRLFNKYSEINRQRKAYKEETYEDFGSDLDNIENAIESLTEIEQQLIQFENKKDRIQDAIRITNNLIRSHGGHQILTTQLS